MGGWKTDLRLWGTVLLALICLSLILRMPAFIKVGTSSNGLPALPTWTSPWNSLKSTGYALYREYARWKADRDTGDWLSLEGKQVILRYRPEDADQAKSILEETDRIYPQVKSTVGYSPKDKPLVLLYSERESFNQVFGWKDQSAMGVYYAGVVRVLSPRIWSQSGEDMTGPMAHELAHLVLDYQTGGNVPRWFTEGVAQDMERRVSGYTLTGPKGDWANHLYPWSSMDLDFDQLPDQRLAYRQSLLAVDSIQRFGPDALPKAVAVLAEGGDVTEAVKVSTGLTWDEYTAQVEQQAKKTQK
ncbi:hypothetical protein GJ688_16915 [Heliobacillus mobilis]|uniref:Peptidase MA-like domain-containing protein n=1 Tax=Heliobacterium mobile TaxID=28064 RepID=A0A6I3SNM7_HELMO|nr:hypothetical protein [Heliobacterium mobile]MTV50621.1 hypothetical protein [Heliobacterium mobile]